ncbi:MAG: hypothetical protein AAFR59_19085, partial [Bacteroidota bacterium]
MNSLDLTVAPGGGTQLTGVPSRAVVEAAAGGDSRAFLEYLYDFEDGHYMLTHLESIPYGGANQQRKFYVTGRYSPLDSIPDDPERSSNTGTGNLAPNDRFTEGYIFIESNRSVVPENSLTFALSFQEYNGLKPDGFFFLYNHSAAEEGATFSFKCADAYHGEGSYLRQMSGYPGGPISLADYDLDNIPNEAYSYAEAVEFTNVDLSLAQVTAAGKEHTVFVTLNALVEDSDAGETALVAAIPYQLIEGKGGQPDRKISLGLLVAPQPVARAHDPNYIAVDRNHFLYGPQSSGNVYPNCVDLTYEVHYQNIGEAP